MTLQAKSANSRRVLRRGPTGSLRLTAAKRVVLALIGVALIVGSLVLANPAGVLGLVVAVPVVALGGFLIALSLGRTRQRR